MTGQHGLPHDPLAGGGEMGALMRSIDWACTAVGPVDTWPQSLRTALSILLETGFPMYIAWGAEFTQFYNDGYRPILGSTKHPAAMGISTRETFAEIWDIIGPMFARVMQGSPPPSWTSCCRSIDTASPRNVTSCSRTAPSARSAVASAGSWSRSPKRPRGCWVRAV